MSREDLIDEAVRKSRSFLHGYVRKALKPGNKGTRELVKYYVLQEWNQLICDGRL